jgi:DNA repair exonuclease SbcCD ATPase subunit
MALFNIVIDVVARTASFEEGMKRIEERLDHFGEVAAEAGKKFLEFAGVGVGLESLTRAIEQAVERGDQMNTLASRMKTTTENLTQLEYAAKLADVPFSSLASSLDEMSKNLSMAAEGTGRAQKAFEDLGINAADLLRLPLAKQFEEIAQKIAGLESATDQARVAMQIFSGMGANLLPILKGGAAGVQKFREESDRLGNTLGTESAHKLAETEESIKRLKASYDGLASTLTSKVAPALTAVFDALRHGEGNFTAAEKTEREIEQLTDTIERHERVIANIKEGSWLNKLLGGNPQMLQDEIRLLNEAQARLEEIQKKANESPAPIPKVLSPSVRAELEDNFKWFDEHVKKMKEYNDKVDEATSDLQKEFAEHYKQMDETTQTSLEKQLAMWDKQQGEIQALMDLGVEKGGISAEEGSRRLNALMDDNLQEIQVHTERTTQKIGKTFGTLSQISRQAAHSAQDAFADFLFDPFEKGLDGLLKSWIDIIRRMAAEAAAAQLFKKLFGDSDTDSTMGLINIFKGFLGGKSSGGTGPSAPADYNFDEPNYGGEMAAGGPLEQGKWYIAGEHGPEKIWGGGSGAFAMGYGNGGGMNFSPMYNIDARGATQDAITLLPQAMKQAHDAAVSTIMNMRRRGRL